MRNAFCRIVLIGLVSHLAAAGAMGQDPPRRDEIPTLTVTGEAEVSAAPDTVVVNLGIHHQNANASAAQTVVNEGMQRILAALVELGIDKQHIQTVRVSLSPIYSNERSPMPREAENEPRLVGYRADNGIQVTLSDTTRAGPMIDAAMKAGANRVEGIYFTLKDDRKQREEALRQAVKNASEKAAVMSAALNTQLGAVQGASEEVMGSPQPRYRAGFAQAMAASTPIEAGQVQITARVTLTYRITPGGPETQRPQP